ncbi:MAG: toll/interleukin-1 receptor domain-containing protein, partial [bacterium]
MATIRIFISYAREDKRWFQRDSQYTLIPYLIESLRKEDVSFWYDAEGLGVGDEFKRRIEEAIDNAHIALLIISQSFLASDFIEHVELPRIQARADQGRMLVIPVLVEPCAWEEDEFLNARQMLPGKPTPLIDYSDNERAMAHVRYEILDGLKKVVRRLRAPVSPPSPPALSETTSETATIAEITLRPPEVQARTPPPQASEAENTASLNRFLGALPWLNWIQYDPSAGYDPYRNLFASEWEIRQDLEVLRTHGFNGVITMSSRQTFKDIPRIAREVGFNMVIQGIWDLKNQEEISNAVSAAQQV